MTKKTDKSWAGPAAIAGAAIGSAALAVTEPNDLREGQRVAVGGEVAQHSAGRY